MHIRAVLHADGSVGEGYRKVWARLRLAGVRTSKRRTLRLMGEHNLLAPTRAGHPHGPKAHEGTITTTRPDEVWGIDITSAVTRQEGTANVVVLVDHRTADCLGLHVAMRATRFEAIEPLRQAVPFAHGAYEQGRAVGLRLRHDHGSQFLSDHFQAELPFPGDRVLARVCSRARRQRLRRALHSDTQGVTAVDQHLRHDRRAAGCAHRFLPALQPRLVGRETRLQDARCHPGGLDHFPRRGSVNIINQLSKEPGAVQDLSVSPILAQRVL